MNALVIKIKKLPHFKGTLPEYKSLGAAGFDVRACLSEPVHLEPGRRALVPAGFCVEIPQGFELQARPRSGLALKQGLTLLNTPGTIDSDYRGEVKILLINNGTDPALIKDQDRIAQLVLCQVFRAKLSESDKLSETLRGGGGFGSTGV